MAETLLAPGEPIPVTVRHEEGSSPFMLVADHAGNVMPRALGRLGIAAAECERHIAWDIGIAGLGRVLADALDATLIQQNYSRLVIDCNRPPNVASSIPLISEATTVPGNEGITREQAALRRAQIFDPYHQRIDAIIDARRHNNMPTILVSPWSKGGWVCSEVFDHTSLIRFIERRFGPSHPGLIETNITAWRRAVCGDLTSAFDFATPHVAPAALPDTAAYAPPDHLRHPDYVPVPPTDQALPSRERGLRHARAIPYELHATGTADIANNAFRIDFANPGQAGACFQVRSGNTSDGPWTTRWRPGSRCPTRGLWRKAIKANTIFPFTDRTVSFENITGVMTTRSLTFIANISNRLTS
jgi:hypothetical protein